MANSLTLYFKRDDIQYLLNQNPDYFLVRVNVETGEISGKKVAVMVVYADAFRKNEPVLASREGCPVPPCVPGEGIISDGTQCDNEVESLLDSYKTNNFSTGFNF